LLSRGSSRWVNDLYLNRYNSLHAQREACEAFIKSQAGEGWRLIRTAYDDGGLSGGTMERPALQRMLADINEGQIDVVVVGGPDL
jgi:site-specific DNA recombinase